MKKDDTIYVCILNGKTYGKGDMRYMTELFTDFFSTMDMYGREESEFKLIRKSKQTKENGK